ncbi:MAG: family 1 glycosylhydrolase [Chthoniobacterales bacterium]
MPPDSIVARLSQTASEIFERNTLELWGGAECTINRVGDKFFSQLDRSGRREKLEDFDRFAELGIRRLRFPILWEDLAPASLDGIDWRRVDAQLQRLRDLGIQPIAGLVHHGSGPRYTSLIDPEFPTKLAAFARLVAERYPWIDAYTPVNEPLTTARFSGLYGHWYPHGRDAFTFSRALLNQCRGVALAMRAIRQVNPSAALVQTDDLGKTYAGPRLQYQADFENDRRWVTWDLLCGWVDRAHPMWSYFEWSGIEPESVSIFRNEPCPPDMVGLNYYITSERFLDANLRDHPPDIHGGNGRDRYADVAVVRVRAEGIAGPERILREACARYGLPVAITEAHLGCTREEQLRWFKEVWDAAQAVRSDGLDVRAVTAWSLLGAYDWNSVLTRQDNYYEPGAFDLRGPDPRATAIAKMIGRLGRGASFAHPVLEPRGWWHRPVRFLGNHRGRDEVEGLCDYCPTRDNITPLVPTEDEIAGGGRPVLVTGGSGRVARGFVAAAQLRGLPVRVVNRRELDIADPDAVQNLLRAVAPWAVINCAGFSRVDDAERNERECLRSNVHGAQILANACVRSATPLVTFSSDFVFDGRQAGAYSESAAPAALNVYGESKLLAEQKILAAFPGALIIRPGKLFAPDAADFLRKGLTALAEGKRLRVANDTRCSPTYLPDLVHATLDLLIDGECGVWHLANDGAFTAEEFFIAAADHAQLDTSLVEGVPAWSLHREALRPRNRALRSERGQLLPPLSDALHRYLRELPALPPAERVLAM